MLPFRALPLTEKRSRTFPTRPGRRTPTVAQRIFGLITRAGPFPHTRSPAAFESPVLRNLATKTIDFARRTVFRFGDTFNFPIDGFRPTGFALKVAFTVLA